MKRILFVCHGNICRSPMAEFVMRDLAKKNGIEAYVASAATSTEEIGNNIHQGTRKKLREMGVPAGDRQAVQMTKADYEKYDYIVGMDSFNIRNIMRIIGEDTDGKVCKLLSFTGSGGDIADPWYTGNFDETYDDVLRGCKALLDVIKSGETA